MSETKITNEQIATEVMGWWQGEKQLPNPRTVKSVWCYKAEDVGVCVKEAVPQFLTDLNAAEMIIKKLYADGMFVSIDNDYIGDKYDVMFFGKASENEAQNKSLCVAICEAALKAVRG